VDPSHVPPPSPPPICLKSLARDIKRTGVGKGRSRCWSSPVSVAPTEFSHGTDPSNMPDPPVISDGSPFCGENTPVGAPEPKMSPLQQQRSFRGMGGCQGEEKKLDGGGGGWAGKRMCCLKYLLSEKKFTGPLHLNPTHISFLNSCNH
jgi:hypothetical protein